MLPSQLESLCVNVCVSGSAATWLTLLACAGSPSTGYFGCWFLALETLGLYSPWLCLVVLMMAVLKPYT